MFSAFSQYSQKNAFVGVSFNTVAGLQACNSIKKESPPQVFSCEYCKIFKNSFFYRTPLVPASRIETFFEFVIHTTLKSYEDSMTQT